MNKRDAPSGAPYKWATFDCYGTLIDWDRGIRAAFSRLWPQADADELLARYHAIEPVVQRGSGAPYREVLAMVLGGVAAALSLELDPKETDALSRSLPEWPPFPEVPDALREVRNHGWRTAILSNTDPDLLSASMSNIEVPFEATISAGEIGSYKPAHEHWHAFARQTGVDASCHVHVAASIFHDIEPAHELGIPTIWINRAQEECDVPRAAELPDLTGLADALDGLVS